MTEILFIRHGESSMNTRPDLVGGRSYHTSLTIRGSRQAALFGDYLRSEQIRPDVVFASPAIRTDTTARIALDNAGIDMPVLHDDRLLEISHGTYEGQPRKNVYSEANKRRYRISELDGKLPGGESVLDVDQRMRPFIHDVHEQYPDGTAYVFGHGFAIRSLAGMIRGLTKPEIFAELTPNLSVTSITMSRHTPTVHYVGKTIISE